MKRSLLASPAVFIALILVLAAPATAQFRDDFDGPSLPVDPEGVRGWGFQAGEGNAVMEFVQGGPGFASIRVDATKDRRNVWWAFIKRRVSDRLDLAELNRPGHALRVEARIRVSDAPRRVNLHLNTQKTTDFHSHLMEYDIPEANAWRTISMTTSGFEAVPGDTVNAQMALMDWGLGQYRVDIDYFKVDVVDVAAAGPDLGEPIPYHPPVADPASFRHEVVVAADATVDAENSAVNLGDWKVADASGTIPVIAAGGSKSAILRWDLRPFAGKTVAGSGLLVLTTRSLARAARDIPDFGQIRVVEILGGDPAWTRPTVTFESLLRGQPPDLVLCPQMIIDWPVAEGDGARTPLTIPRPVLQRLVDGKSLGIAVRPLGAIEAAFYSLESGGADKAPMLLFNIR